MDSATLTARRNYLDESSRSGWDLASEVPLWLGGGHCLRDLPACPGAHFRNALSATTSGLGSDLEIGKASKSGRTQAQVASDRSDERTLLARRREGSNRNQH